MSKKAVSAITVVASVIGLIVGKLGVQSYFDHREATALDRALVDAASQLNAKLPMQGDRYTRLDSTLPGPGRRFTYFYTLTDIKPDDLDISKFTSAMRLNIINGTKTNPDSAVFRDNGVELHYVYRDSVGKFVTEIVVSPKDLK